MSNTIQRIAEQSGFSEEVVIRVTEAAMGEYDGEDTCPICGNEYMYQMTRREMFGDDPPSPIMGVRICIGQKSAYLHSTEGDTQ